MTSRRTLLILLVLVHAVAACSEPEPSKLSWVAASANNEANSTHLWIVNRALDLLSRQPDLAVAERLVDKLQGAECRAAWQQGLLDADYLAVYNNGTSDISPGAWTVQIKLAGTTWKSHFFDVDTGTNYKGETSPTAYTEALRFAPKASDAGWTGTSNADAERRSCYALGLSLHYFTDITQPAHAANFSALERPIGLHSDLEGYAMAVQNRYVLADWSGVPSGSLENHILATARASKSLWPVLLESVAEAYTRSHANRPVACGRLDTFAVNVLVSQELDRPSCWNGDASVDGIIRESLILAQDKTAQYLYLIGLKTFGQDR